MNHSIESSGKKYWLIGYCIIGLAAILRFFHMTYGDMYSDNALYSYRSLGWFDSLKSANQLSPFDLLGHTTWWSTLSFHDAPPAVFFIQHIFFLIFGGSVFAARLPFVLAGIGSVVLIVLLCKKAGERMLGLVAGAILAINSYAIWASHAGYLEGVEQFFILLSALALGVFLSREYSRKYLWISILGLALAITSKYTALFLIPVFLYFLFIHRKKIWEKVGMKRLALYVGSALIILLPVILYNIQLVSFRGHPDAALSSMLGIHTEDFAGLATRTVSFNFISNIGAMYYTLATNDAPLFAILFVISLIYLVIKTIRRKSSEFQKVVLFTTIACILLLSISVSAARFLSILNPWMALVIGTAAIDLYIWIKGRHIGFRAAFFALVSVAVVWEVCFMANTNLLSAPSTSPMLVSPERIQSFGLNQVEDFLRADVLSDISRRSIHNQKDFDFDNNEVRGKKAIIFDDRINWFAQFWYSAKYVGFYHWPFITTSYFANGIADPLNSIGLVSNAPLLFVYPLREDILDPDRVADTTINSASEKFHAMVEQQGFSSVVINDSNGIPAFKIYTIDHTITK